MSKFFGVLDLNDCQIEQKKLENEVNANPISGYSYTFWNNHNISFGYKKTLCDRDSTHENFFEHLSYPVYIIGDIRLDNRDELIRTLGRKHSEISDYEITLLYYLKYKDRCVDHFVGAFSFAIWDDREKLLFCARDHIGVKPFFYYLDNNKFVFSPILQDIIKLEGADLSINDNYVFHILGRMQLRNEETFYKRIKTIPPAHTLLLQGKNLQVNRYWELDYEKRLILKNDTEYIEAFREHFWEAVNCRLDYNQTNGIELSGGLDSSGIAVAANDLLKKKGKELHTFSYVMKKEDRGNVFPYEDEKDLIDELCMKSGIDKKFFIDASVFNSYVDYLDFSLWLNGGVNIHCAGHLDSLKTEAEIKGVSVLLSGFLGDNMVSSFAENYFLEYLNEGQYRKYLYSILKRPALIKKGLKFGFLFFINIMSRSYAESMNQKFQPRKVSLKNRGLDNIFFSREILNKYPELTNKLLPLKSTKLNFNFRQLEWNKLCGKPVQKRLSGEYVGSLYRGMETRYPLADIRLLQFVSSIPAHQKRNEKYQRLIYRRAFNNSLPDSIAWQKHKTRTTMPFAYAENLANFNILKEWLISMKDDNNQSIVNVDKLIKMSDSLISEKSMNDGKPRYARKQLKSYLLMRYFQKNGTNNLHSFKIN